MMEDTRGALADQRLPGLQRLGGALDLPRPVLPLARLADHQAGRRGLPALLPAAPARLRLAARKAGELLARRRGPGFRDHRRLRLRLPALQRARRHGPGRPHHGSHLRGRRHLPGERKQRGADRDAVRGTEGVNGRRGEGKKGATAARCGRGLDTTARLAAVRHSTDGLGPCDEYLSPRQSAHSVHPRHPFTSSPPHLLTSSPPHPCG